jgi:hypothetical protein
MRAKWRSDKLSLTAAAARFAGIHSFFIAAAMEPDIATEPAIELKLVGPAEPAALICSCEFTLQPPIGAPMLADMARFLELAPFAKTANTA